MKFSKLEQEEIKKICEWGKTSNVFSGINHYLSHYGLPDGTGIFSFPNKHLILCFDSEIFDQNNFYPDGGNAINKTVFTLNFILKLERLNFVTLVTEKGVEFLHSFKGDGVSVYINNIEKNNFNYEFSYLSDKVNSTKAKLICKDNVIIDTNTNKQIYFCLPIYFELDTYRLLSSYMTINQELFELVSNDFKTYEDIQLEEAKAQTKAAYDSLEEARKQTKASLDSLAETIKQTQKTQESLDEAQKQSYQARTQTGLSILTLFLSVGAILWSIYASNEIPITINQSQFDSIQIQQKVLIETLNEIKMSQMDKDSVIKELDSTKAKIDKISNTLKELKKMNSKGK